MTNATRPSSVDSGRLRLLLVLVLGSGGAAVLSAPPLAGAVPDPWAFWLVAAGFLLGEVAPVHVRIGHNRYSYTLSEAPLVVGLVVIGSPWVAVAAAVGLTTAHVALRRSPLKIAYNALSNAAGAMLAWFVVAASGPIAIADVARPRGLSTLVLASLAFALWNGLTVSAVVGLSQGVKVVTVFQHTSFLRLISWIANTGLSLLALCFGVDQPLLVGLVPLVVLGLYGFFRGYARVVEDRDTWQVLQATSRELSSLHQDDIAAVVLDRAATLFRAEFVELLVVDGEPAERATVYRQSAGGGSEQIRAATMDVAGEFWPRASSEREPFQVHTRDAPAAQRRELENQGLAVCVVAPVVGGGTCLGTLRVGFHGEVGVTGRELQALGTFVAQVATSLLNARYHETVTEERAKLGRILGSTSDGILSVDAAGRITSWNPAMERMTALTATEVVGQQLTLGAAATAGPIGGRPDDRVPVAWAWLQDQLAERDAVVAAVDLCPPDSTPRFLHLSVSAVRGPDGLLESAVLVARDVTAQREVEQAKEDFLATVSHELRSPITSLRGWLLTLLRPEYDPAPDERRLVYESLLHRTDGLQRLVEDLLSVSVLERGEFKVDTVALNVDEVVAKAVDDLARTAPTRPITHRRAGLAGMVIGDPGRVGQVVANLLSNADKYSPRGMPVTVEVERVGGKVRISITDQGPGIPDDLQEAVFDRFRRLGNHMTRDAGGTGLGLHIARALVQAMGGEIWVESRLGEGSTFRFTLPAAPLILHAVG